MVGLREMWLAYNICSFSPRTWISRWEFEEFRLRSPTTLLHAFTVWNIKKCHYDYPWKLKYLSITGEKRDCWLVIFLFFLPVYKSKKNYSHFLSYVYFFVLKWLPRILLWNWLLELENVSMVWLKSHWRTWKEACWIQHPHGRVPYILPLCLFFPKREAWIRIFLKWGNRHFEVSLSLLKMTQYAVSTVTIPSLLYEYLFSTLEVCPPFTAIENNVFNNLMVSPSQLHQSGWAYVKFYQ